jgi:hypothetical protein
MSFITLNNTVMPNLNSEFEITIMIGHNAATAPDHTLVGFGASTNTKVTFPIYKASGILNASGGYKYHRLYYDTSAPLHPLCLGAQLCRLRPLRHLQRTNLPIRHDFEQWSRSSRAPVLLWRVFSLASNGGE